MTSFGQLRSSDVDQLLARMHTSRSLNIAAVALMLIPLGIALFAQLAIWMIPGCNPNPYALGECLMGSINLAPTLMLGVLGGIYIGIVTVPVAVILMLAGIWLTKRRANKTGEIRSE